MTDQDFAYDIVSLNDYTLPNVSFTLDSAVAMIAYAIRNDGHALASVWCDDGGLMRCKVHTTPVSDGKVFSYIEPARCTSKQASNLLVEIFNLVDDINHA